MDDLVSLVAFKKAIFSLRKRRFQYTREVKAWFLNFKIKLLNVVYVKLDNRAKGGHPPPPPKKKKYIKNRALACPAHMVDLTQEYFLGWLGKHYDPWTHPSHFRLLEDSYPPMAEPE